MNKLSKDLQQANIRDIEDLARYLTVFYEIKISEGSSDYMETILCEGLCKFINKPLS